jgi:hypothetical protein
LKDPVGFVPLVTVYLALVNGYGGAELLEIVLDVERVGDVSPDDKRRLYLIAYHRVTSSSIRTAALQDMEVPQSPAHFVAALYRACRGDVEEDIRCRVDELSSSKNTKGIDGVLGWLEDMRSLYERHLDDFRYVPAEDRTMIAVVASGVLAGYIQLHIGEPTCRQEARPTLMQWARDGRCRWAEVRRLCSRVVAEAQEDRMVTASGTAKSFNASARGPGPSRRAQGKRDPKALRCYACKKPGHVKREYPERKFKSKANTTNRSCDPWSDHMWSDRFGSDIFVIRSK